MATTNTMTTNGIFFPCFLYILLTFFYNLTRLHVQNGNDDCDDDCDNEWLPPPPHQHYDNEWYLFSSVFLYILLTFFYNLTRLRVWNGNNDYDDEWPPPPTLRWQTGAGDASRL